MKTITKGKAYQIEQKGRGMNAIYFKGNLPEDLDILKQAVEICIKKIKDTESLEPIHEGNLMRKLKEAHKILEDIQEWEEKTAWNSDSIHKH